MCNYVERLTSLGVIPHQTLMKRTPMMMMVIIFKLQCITLSLFIVYIFYNFLIKDDLPVHDGSEALPVLEGI